MNSKNREYVVTVATSTGGRDESIDHHSPNGAAHMAQRLFPGSVILDVRTRWKVIGDCEKCGAVILDNENFKEISNDLFECESCKA